MKKIFITGANGQLGKTFAFVLQKRSEYKTYLYDKSDLDITDNKKIKEQLRQVNPDAVINCAAFTQVDLAESKSELAYKINEKAPGLLAAACKELAIPIFHYSTDYVYHNGMNLPMSEKDPTNPQSIYAKSKLAGELTVIKNNPFHFIFRTSWVFSPFGQNFLKTMLGLGKKNDELKVVYDQIGAPTYTFDLVDATLEFLSLIWSGNSPEPGVYNFSNSGVCSWYDFSLAIFNEAKLEVKVQPVRSDMFPRPAPRPPYSVLDCLKITKVLKAHPRHWNYAVSDCLKFLS